MLIVLSVSEKLLNKNTAKHAMFNKQKGFSFLF